jgi:hypothetical protein
MVQRTADVDLSRCAQSGPVLSIGRCALSVTGRLPRYTMSNVGLMLL